MTSRGGPPTTSAIAASPTGSLSFECNLCGQANSIELGDLTREGGACVRCSSTVRFRSVAAALSVALFGHPHPLNELPRYPHLRGLGLSDVHLYADALSSLFDYENTFFDREPFFDITAPVPPARVGTYDFVVCSEVLEHVPPPYELALQHCRQLLKPGGFLVVTVPLKREPGTTDEHFPDLYDHRIVEQDGEPVLINRRRDGRTEVYRNLVFHGDFGATLEMRLISPNDLEARLRSAGFDELRWFGHPYPQYGIWWEHAWQSPVVARAGDPANGDRPPRPMGG